MSAGRGRDNGKGPGGYVGHPPRSGFPCGLSAWPTGGGGLNSNTRWHVKVAQSIWTPAEGWPVAATGDELPEAHLVLAFGSPFSLQQATVLRDLQRRYPQARVVGCSTAGEICGPHVYDDTLCATAVQFAGTTVRTAAVEITDAGASRLAGRDLAVRLAGSDLAHVLVFSDGLDVNGSALVEGLLEHLPPGVTLTGGLSADGERFRNTLVLHDGEARRRVIAAVGLYGRALRVGYRFAGRLGSVRPGPHHHPFRRQRVVRAGWQVRAGAVPPVPGQLRQGSAGVGPAVPAAGADLGYGPRRGAHHPRHGRDVPEPDLRGGRAAGRAGPPDEGQLRPADRRGHRGGAREPGRARGARRRSWRCSSAAWVASWCFGSARRRRSRRCAMCSGRARPSPASIPTARFRR
jgi:hypothetical protein